MEAPSFISQDNNKTIAKLTEGAETVLRNANVVTNKYMFIIRNVPLVAIILGILSIITLFVFILLFIIYKYSPGGITRARNIYSGFYLITCIIIAFVTVKFANPILDTDENSESMDTESDKLRNDMVAILNSIVNTAAFPVMMCEVLFLVLGVFVITLMFVIPSSLLRTYYAIQCPLNQKIEVVWWGKIVDFFIYCMLGVFFLFYLICQGMNAFTKYVSHNSTSIKRAVLVSRYLFVMALSYYIIQLLFSSIEYIISNNIISIHNWNTSSTVCSKSPQEICIKNPEETKTQGVSKYIENIFYLFLNIILCIFIWLIILVLIIVHIYVDINIIHADKIVSLVYSIFTILMFLLSGKVTFSGLERAIDTVLNKIRRYVPSGVLPQGVPKSGSAAVLLVKNEMTKLQGEKPATAPATATAPTKTD